MPGQLRRTEPEDVLPAITLDVEPTQAGLDLMSARLTSFADDHELPRSVGSRMVSVASDVADILARALAAPAGSLRVEADIGLADAQLVVTAADHGVPALYPSLRPSLDRIAPRCDAFVAELASNSELQVWACFRLG